MTTLGFGCSSLMGSGSRTARQRLLAVAHDAGVRHFDVAPSYGAGFAEAELGRFVAGRSDVTVSTKVGIDSPRLLPTVASRGLSLARRGSLATRVAAREHERQRGRFDPVDIRRSVERSLRRLRRERIDLLLLHEYDVPADGRVAEVVDTLASLVSEGVVATWGVGSEQERLFGLLDLGFDPPVVQVEDSLRRPSLERVQAQHAGPVTTHRALGETLLDLEARRRASTAALDPIAAASGVSIETTADLVAVLLAVAAARNPDGRILFSSRAETRVRETVAAAQALALDASRAGAVVRAYASMGQAL